MSQTGATFALNAVVEVALHDAIGEVAIAFIKEDARGDTDDDMISVDSEPVSIAAAYHDLLSILRNEPPRKLACPLEGNA